MPSQNSTSMRPSSSATLHPSRRARIAGWLAVGAVMVLAFIGYLTPDMRIQWENFLSLCGF